MSTTLPAPAGPTLMTVGEFWDYCLLPENADRSLELIRGVVVDMTPVPGDENVSRAARIHGVVCANVSFELGMYCRRTRAGYVAINDPGVVLQEDPATVVGPDAAYYTDVSRYANLPEKWGTTLPVLVVEVVSPTERPGAVAAKMHEYLRAGVPLIWLVDPADETATVFSPAHAPVTLTAADTLAAPEMPGFACPVADLFPAEAS